MFGYSIGQIRKALVAAIVLGFAVVGYLITVPVGFEGAFKAIALAVLGVVAVAGAKNSTANDWTKAAMAAVTSIAGMATLYTGANYTPVEDAIAAFLAVALPLLVHQIPNDPVPTQKQ